MDYQNDSGHYGGSHPRRLYRSRDARLLGVCAGLAEYFEMPVKVVRLFTILAAVFTGFWPMLIGYVVVALILKPAPQAPIASDEQADFWALCYRRPDAAMERIRQRRADLDRRLQRLESIVTSPQFNLEEEFRRL